MRILKNAPNYVMLSNTEHRMIEYRSLTVFNLTDLRRIISFCLFIELKVVAWVRFAVGAKFLNDCYW